MLISLHYAFSQLIHCKYPLVRGSANYPTYTQVIELLHYIQTSAVSQFLLQYEGQNISPEPQGTHELLGEA